MNANDILIGNPLSGNGWKKLFALTLVWAATALVASAQKVTTLYSFQLSDGASPEFVTPAQGRDGDIYGTTFIGGSSTACGSVNRCARWRGSGGSGGNSRKERAGQLRIFWRSTLKPQKWV